MSIENKFLFKLLETKDWDTVIERGITPEYLTGVNKRAFKWVGDFKVKYGELPTVETFEKHFPDVALDKECSEGVAYYCDEVRNKVKQNKLVAVLDKLEEKLDKRDVDGCYSELATLLLEVNTQFTFTDKADVGVNTKERFDDYELSKATGGLMGYPIGIKPIDRQTGGMKGVDLFTVLGKSGLGKSWFLCLVACNLINAGYKVLFVTKEMSPNQLLKRIDSILSGVSYNRLKNGKLTAKEEEKYKNYLENIAPRYKNKLSIELVVNGVTECIAKADAFQPEIVLVDGGYLMSEAKDTEDWKGILDVWKGLKTFALSRKIPVIVTSQLKDGEASVKNISYVKGLAQYCDAIYALEQDDVMKASKEVKVVNLKIRDGEYMTPFVMEWDFTEMHYNVIYEETPASKLTVEEPVSLTKID